MLLFCCCIVNAAVIQLAVAVALTTMMRGMHNAEQVAVRDASCVDVAAVRRQKTEDSGDGGW